MKRNVATIANSYVKLVKIYKIPPCSHICVTSEYIYNSRNTSKHREIHVKAKCKLLYSSVSSSDSPHNGIMTSYPNKLRRCQ